MCCKIILSANNFYKDKSNSTGLQTYCKQCQKKKSFGGEIHLMVYKRIIL